MTLPVLWGDMDAFNHVNNVRFFRWLESIRIEYFQRINMSQYMSNKGIGPILAHTSCDYLLPVNYPDNIELKASVTNIGNSSLTQSYLVVSEQLGKPVAKGEAVIVMVDYQSGQKVNIPDEMRQAIESIEASED